jgi:hypothetical protein
LAKKRKSYDWEAIEKAFRAGMLSICEIGRQYGLHESTIRKRAKKLAWKRDLTERVRERVRAKLVPSRTKEEQATTEDQAIEEAAALAVSVIRDHQKRIGRIFKALDTLVADLESGETDLRITGDDSESIISIPMKPSDKSGLLNALGNTISKLIPLERQAHNIQDGLEGSEEGKKGGRYTSFPHDDLTIEEWQEAVGLINNENSDTDNS